jgi:hypothetical protein
MVKASVIGRVVLGVVIAAAIAGVLVLRVVSHRTPRYPPPPPPSAARGCEPPGWQDAASVNRASLHALSWAPFGRAETGWATYAPLVAHEIGAACAAGSGGFAKRYALWQAQNGRTADGIFKPDEFAGLRDTLALRRPFVQLTARGLCPAPPDASRLVPARADEGYGGKVVRLRPGALEAYRRIVAAAKDQGLARRPPLLKLVSGYRDPAEEAARCAGDACDTLTRARCSAHRTGLALDLYLDPAPGADPASTADANRAHMAATPEYRWLVAHAQAFGFVPYAYEPWHWEWTGEAP